MTTEEKIRIIKSWTIYFRIYPPNDTSTCGFQARYSVFVLPTPPIVSSRYSSRYINVVTGVFKTQYEVIDQVYDEVHTCILDYVNTTEFLMRISGA